MHCIDFLCTYLYIYINTLKYTYEFEGLKDDEPRVYLKCQVFPPYRWTKAKHDPPSQWHEGMVMFVRNLRSSSVALAVKKDHKNYNIFGDCDEKEKEIEERVV